MTRQPSAVRTLCSVAVAIAAIQGAAAHAAAQDCEALKTTIAAKIDSKGVKAYSLDIVDAAQAEGLAEGSKVVASCGGGAKRIVYARGGKVQGDAPKAAKAAKPAASAASGAKG